MTIFYHIQGKQVSTECCYSTLERMRYFVLVYCIITLKNEAK